MNRLVYSALGRQLWSSDWLRIHGDTVMKVLYDLHTNPFNPQNASLPQVSLHHATGLSPQNLLMVLDRLKQEGLVEEDSQHRFRITDLGINVVSTMPAYGPGAGSFGTGSLG